jgi:hypothetical protein
MLGLVRLITALVVMFGLVGSARADDALKPYAGKIVISPAAPPTAATELPAYLAANAVKDGSYDLTKGPPWPMHLVGVLARDATKPVTLVFADKADKKLAPLFAIQVSSTKRVVIAHTEATVAAGFAAGKTYLVRLMFGKVVLARAELTLRD